jgi:hypothetical protein
MYKYVSTSTSFYVCSRGSKGVQHIFFPVYFFFPWEEEDGREAHQSSQVYVTKLTKIALFGRYSV